MAELNVTLPLWWVLGIIALGVGGSYTFTWLVFNEWRKGNAKLWEAITEIKDNEIKHIEGRLDALEKDN
ncbi:hypothetical protein LCGC14_2142360 [marine sediment metagenome]|uniref:Uncharacterized protein n=1 Tax=marine sediment metagenome TaxID=412755 RepID=A0A0F9GU89_9ZZZZ